MQLTGVIKQMFDVETHGESFKKRQIVITTSENYPQNILVEFVQDKVALLDGYKEGDRVEIKINIRGREWNSPDGVIKYFVHIQGWKIEGKRSETQAQGHAGKFASFSSPDSEVDDLPF